MKVDMFAPGTVYLVYGECHYSTTSWPFIGKIAYKIGATSRRPEVRVNEAKGDIWRFRENLKLVHTIPVDNMRVVELMFHRKFHEYAIAHDRACDWFFLQGRKHGVTCYESIEVTDALRSLAQSDDVRSWWKGLGIAGRQEIALKLWRHPLTRSVLRW